jgi:hypothetical protein
MRPLDEPGTANRCGMGDTLPRPWEHDKSERIGHSQEVVVWLGKACNPSGSGR